MLLSIQLEVQLKSSAQNIRDTHGKTTETGILCDTLCTWLLSQFLILHNKDKNDETGSKRHNQPLLGQQRLPRGVLTLQAIL